MEIKWSGFAKANVVAAPLKNIIPPAKAATDPTNCKKLTAKAFKITNTPNLDTATIANLKDAQEEKVPIIPLMVIPLRAPIIPLMVNPLIEIAVAIVAAFIARTMFQAALSNKGAAKIIRANEKSIIEPRKQL